MPTPRVRGGTTPDRVARMWTEGLSPRARGNPESGRHALCIARPIPACAGEPWLSDRPRILGGAYPRVRGGTRDADQGWGHGLGLSPRARGNPAARTRNRPPLGPIPACAGEPARRAALIGLTRAYPRVRGGTTLTLADFLGPGDLSPRARGNHRASLDDMRRIGPIPACAGEPGRPGGTGRHRWAYPRVRGGTDYLAAMRPPDRGLSPRARGNPLAEPLRDGAVRPIPACAGEPSGC